MGGDGGARDKADTTPKIEVMMAKLRKKLTGASSVCLLQLAKGFVDTTARFVGKALSAKTKTLMEA